MLTDQKVREFLEYIGCDLDLLTGFEVSGSIDDKILRVKEYRAARYNAPKNTCDGDGIISGMNYGDWLNKQ